MTDPWAHRRSAAAVWRRWAVWAVSAAVIAAGLWPGLPAGAQAGRTGAFDARAGAADPPGVGSVDELLSPDRWTESAFGLSVRIPRDVQVIEQAADGSLVKFLSPRGWTVSLFLRRSDAAMTLETAAEEAARQATAASAVQIQDEFGGERFAGRPMRKAYFLVPDDEAPWVLGQALMLVDPLNLAVLQLEAQVDQRAIGQAVFEALLDTATLADPRELSARREARIEAGRRFIASITQEQRLAAAAPERWLRVTRGGRDVGYMRAASAADEELGLPGVGVRVRSRLVGEDAVFDSDGSFFLSDDQLTEIWSVRTTARPADAAPRRETLRDQLSAARRGGPGAPGPAPRSESSAETGLRTGQGLVVSIERPGELDDMNWPVLPPAYLSQVDAHLLPYLLPLEEPAELAFYAYNPDTESLALQTVRVIPLEDGRTRVYYRPAASRAEQVLRYDAQGRLTAREMPDGRVVLPASRESILEMWSDSGR